MGIRISGPKGKQQFPGFFLKTQKHLRGAEGISAREFSSPPPRLRSLIIVPGRTIGGLSAPVPVSQLNSEDPAFGKRGERAAKRHRQRRRTQHAGQLAVASMLDFVKQVLAVKAD